MTISAGIKTPGVYTEVNINTQRSGLLANDQRVLFVTKDTTPVVNPISIYDTASADEKFGDYSVAGRMLKAAIKTMRTVDVQACTLQEELDDTLDTIAPLGHTIIAVDQVFSAADDAAAWVDHLNFVSDAIEQRPAILVVPFTDIDAATLFAAQAKIETSYRVVCPCYHGATGQAAEIAGAMAAALADSADPTVPFNGVNLGGVAAVDDQYKLTFERKEAAMRAGVCVIETGADGSPEIVRAISTFRKNPDSGLADGIMLDINGALTIDYVRKVMRTAASKERRRKNTAAQRRNLRSIFLTEALKLDKAEILQNVSETADQLTVTEDTTDRYRVNAVIPANWVRGMHVVAATINVY